MLRVGIDENGLGPRLGPLIVTAVVARASGKGDARAESRPRGKLAKRLGDSKALVSFGSTALGEAWARALARRFGVAASTPAELVHALALDDERELRRLCPPAHEAQCWRADREAFTADASLVDAVSADLDALADSGVDLTGARVGIVCTARLNEALARGSSRFHVDLHTMERLALDLSARFCEGREELAVTCGKVGGIDRYAPHFGPFAGRLHTALSEGRARSEYQFPGFGRLAFVRDADASHLLVAMASLVGKWVRDLLMARIVRYHQEHDPELPLASGYHDPVTARFVALSALARKERALPDDCFERRAISSSSSSAERSPTARPTKTSRPQGSRRSAP